MSGITSSCGEGARVKSAHRNLMKMGPQGKHCRVTLKLPTSFHSMQKKKKKKRSPSVFSLLFYSHGVSMQIAVGTQWNQLP